MKNILITGANGQLGNEIRDISNDFDEFILYFTDIDKLDITNMQHLDDFFSHHRISFIINCAAYTAVDKAEKEISQAELINFKAVENLRQISEKYSTYLIHLSTDYVFDGRSCSPYLEDDPTNPVSAYGLSKLKGEEVLKNCDKAMIIRTSWLFSSHGHNFLKTILKLSEEKSEIKVVFDQIGTPTYAADLARAIMDIIKIVSENPSKFISGIFHYTNEGVCSWYDFAYHIVRQTKHKCTVLPIETKEYPLPAKRPQYSVLNKSKIKLVYGISIPHWTEGLEKCMKKIKE